MAGADGKHQMHPAGCMQYLQPSAAGWTVVCACRGSSSDLRPSALSSLLLGSSLKAVLLKLCVGWYRPHTAQTASVAAWRCMHSLNCVAACTWGTNSAPQPTFQLRISSPRGPHVVVRGLVSFQRSSSLIAASSKAHRLRTCARVYACGVSTVYGCTDVVNAVHEQRMHTVTFGH